MPIAYCLLPIAYCLLPIACSLFPIPYSLKSKNCVPQPIDNYYLWKLNLIQT
ncbi:MAG: hypothetical protein F6J94_07590 [Moorea sp. SIO1F2]|uniref:hypothetical protein n=1 Tax=Moorena sp. SIO1F2 TaxID=2607819 RepID=UPI0013BBEE8A|nr:hypothetical protein [Moorena sp. SIO1F2]NET81819.1 hypothetical protein [Moorena sp. SIO1F2]